MYSDYNILVVGDGMIDEWIEGVAERNEHGRTEMRMVNPVKTRTLGGVYNMAVNFRSLGANVCCVAMVPKESTVGNQYIQIALNQKGIAYNLFASGDYKITVQERYFCDDKYKTWVSYSKPAQATNKTVEDLFQYLHGDSIVVPDALVIWDYDEGMLTESTIPMLLLWARTNHIPVIVDPKLNNFTKYKDVEILKSNDNEALQAVGSNVCLANKVREELDCKYAIVTRGDKGMSIAGEDVNLFIKSHKVADVVCDVGAGDATLAALTLEYLRTGDIERACEVGNIAGSIAVTNKYCGSITVEDLENRNAW